MSFDKGLVPKTPSELPDQAVPAGSSSLKGQMAGRTVKTGPFQSETAKHVEEVHAETRELKPVAAASPQASSEEGPASATAYHIEHLTPSESGSPGPSEPLQDGRAQDVSEKWSKTMERLTRLALTIPPELNQEFLEIKLFGEQHCPPTPESRGEEGQKTELKMVASRIRKQLVSIVKKSNFLGLSKLLPKGPEEWSAAFDDKVANFEIRVQNFLAAELGVSIEDAKKILQGAAQHWVSLVERQPGGGFKQMHGIKGLKIFMEPETGRLVAFFKGVPRGEGSFKLIEGARQFGPGGMTKAVRLRARKATEGTEKEERQQSFKGDVGPELSFRERLRGAPNITGMTRLFYFDKHGQRKDVYFMEEYEGSLDQVTDRRTQRDHPRIFRCFDDVIRALIAMHEMGVVHCDLKNQNILVRDGHGFVNDLGSSAFRGTALKIVTAQPSYMAPEVASHGLADPKIDMFELGMAMLYEFYPALHDKWSTGLPRVIRPPTLERYKQKLSQLQGELGIIDSPLALFIRDLIQYSPDDRPSDEEILPRFEACMPEEVRKKMISQPSAASSPKQSAQ
jgi:hypothetical protein